MCRLLGYVAPSPRSLRELLGASYDSFEQFSCDLHDDGWGVAWFDGSEIRVQKEPVPAHTSDRYRSLADEPFDAALIHYRWATQSLEVELGNTHPFQVETVAFAHNGSVTPPNSLDSLIAEPLSRGLEGTTDSERYFRAVLSASRDSTLEEGLRRTISAIAESLNYSSLNALVLTPEALYAACFFSPAAISTDLPPDYYDMFYVEREGSVIVASSGWDHGNWTPLPNGSLLRIARDTGAVEVTSLSTGVPSS
ncbi:MAG TPA: class II glutamine amidotransferase [Acidimicrobiales bacterium]|jgi:predicted glutamine amidotransferase|nr:class II glutamine amidotransferase [Acidimicrobiales bacterium]